MSARPSVAGCSVHVDAVRTIGIRAEIQKHAIAGKRRQSGTVADNGHEADR